MMAATNTADDSFNRLVDDKSTSQDGDKSSDALIVFNTWNSQVGVGTVTLPWAF